MVFCPSVASGTHKVFDISVLHRPQLLVFPIAKAPEGFGTTDRPGMLTWNKESLIFQGVIGTDVPHISTRHTYRFNDWGFVVLRLEIQPVPGPDEWTTIWEAPRWTVPDVKQ